MARKVHPIRAQWRNAVRKRRLWAGINRQFELSKLTGITQARLSDLERNKAWLRSDEAIILAEALGCEMGALFERTGDAKNQ